MSDDNIIHLDAQRFDRSAAPAENSPRDAIVAALRDYDALCDEHKPQHVIVLFGRQHEDGGSTVGFFQAGSYGNHAQLGLLNETALRMWDGRHGRGQS